MVFGNTGAPLAVDPVKLVLLSGDNMFEENLIELFLLIQCLVQVLPAHVVRVGLCISAEEMREVAAVRVNVQLLVLLLMFAGSAIVLVSGYHACPTLCSTGRDDVCECIWVKRAHFQLSVSLVHRTHPRSL